MNNYNQSLSEVATANMSLEQRIRQSQQALPKNQLEDTLDTASQIVGGEFLNGGFDIAAKSLVKKIDLCAKIILTWNFQNSQNFNFEFLFLNFILYCLTKHTYEK